MIPVILISTSSGRVVWNDSKQGIMLARNIAFISEGTPGRENRVVLDFCIFTPGAVPTVFGRGVDPRGMVAILVRYFITLGLLSRLRLFSLTSSNASCVSIIDSLSA